MSQVVRTTLSCPRCGQTFQGIIEQIVDVGRDPQAKARFLSGRLNMITCPNCGNSMGVGTPLVYHDPERDLLLIHVPMELNIAPQERERVIGDLTKRLTDSIPPEQRRGYLLQPKQALTLPGMIDMILDADGITEDVREAQREKMRVMEMFLQVRPDEWPRMIQDQGKHIDQEFFQLLVATAENAAETGKSQMSEALMILYNFLIQNTEIGQQAMAAAREQEDVLREVAGQLQALGENMNRSDFMNLVLSYAGDESRIQALVGLIRPAFDYAFFQELAQRIEQTDGDDKEQIEALRDRILELTTLLDQQTQVVLQRAADTLRVIVNSEDIDAAIRPRLDQIDDTFLAVLQANIQAAEQRQDLATAARLKAVLQKTLEIMRESAPPQIRFINDLMAATSDDVARALINEQAPQYGPELVELMDAVAQDLEENNQPENAERLRAYSDYAAGLFGEE